MIPNIKTHPLPQSFYNHVAFDQDRSVWAHQGSNEMTIVDWSGTEPQTQTFSWGSGDLLPRACDLLALNDGHWAIHTLTGHHNDGGYDLRVMNFEQLPTGDQIKPWRCPRFYSKPQALDGRIIARRYIKDQGIELVEIIPGEGERAVHSPMPSQPTGFSVVPLPGGQSGLWWGGNVYVWKQDQIEKAWSLEAGQRSTCRRMGEPHGHSAIPGPDGSLYALYNTYSRLHQGGEIFSMAPGAQTRQRVSTPAMPRMEGMVALPDGAFLGVIKPQRNKYAMVWFLEQRKSITLTPKSMGLNDLCVGGVWWSDASQCLYIHNGSKLLRISWDDLKGYRSRKMR